MDGDDVHSEVVATSTCSKCRKWSAHPMDIAFQYCPDDGFYCSDMETICGLKVRAWNRGDPFDFTEAEREFIESRGVKL